MCLGCVCVCARVCVCVCVSKKMDKLRREGFCRTSHNIGRSLLILYFQLLLGIQNARLLRAFSLSLFLIHFRSLSAKLSVHPFLVS